MKRILFLMFLLASSISYAAETCVVTDRKLIGNNQDFRSVTFTYVTDTDGSFDASNTTSGCSYDISNLFAIAYQVTANPGSTAPTDNYVAYILTANGVNLTGAASLDTADSEFVLPLTVNSTEEQVMFRDSITLNSITGNSVSGATGIFEVFIQIIGQYQ